MVYVIDKSGLGKTERLLQTKERITAIKKVAAIGFETIID